MAIVSAIAQGETDIEKLVSLCKTKLKKKIPEMRKALVGIIKEHDRIILQQLLDDIAHYRKQILSIETQISAHTQRVNQELVANLKEVKGIGRQSTEIILAEVGDNVAAFSTADKLTAHSSNPHPFSCSLLQPSPLSTAPATESSCIDITSNVSPILRHPPSGSLACMSSALE